MLIKIKIIFLVFLIANIFAYGSKAAFEKIENLEYVVRKIDDPPIDRNIVKKYDLYELYLENRSQMTFSIPGYSIDLGIDYSPLSEIKSLTKNKSSSKLAVFNVAAGAASLAFGGVAKTAASTLRTVGSIRKQNLTVDEEENFLSPNKTYVLYPNEELLLFLFVDKYLNQSPSRVRLICRDEDSGSNYVLINNKVDLREINAQNGSEQNKQTEKSKENVIAVPAGDVYK